MRNKYKDNIAWLFKRVKADNTATHEETGIPFYCNRETVRKSILNPMSNTYKSVATEVYKTTTQLDFAIQDRVAFTSAPQNNSNYADFSIITDINEKPYLEKGNKHRTVKHKESWLTLS